MVDGKIFIERRTHPRYKVDFPVKYYLVEDPKEIETVREHRKTEKVALARDISLGGLQIASEQPLKEGNILVFEIPLPGNADSILACAEVAWTVGNTGGLHFIKISDDDLALLNAYLKRLGVRT